MKLLPLILIAGALCAQTPPASPLDSSGPAGGGTQPARKETIVVTLSYEPIPLEEADRAVSQTPVRGTRRSITW